MRDSRGLTVRDSGSFYHSAGPSSRWWPALIPAAVRELAGTHRAGELKGINPETLNPIGPKP